MLRWSNHQSPTVIHLYYMPMWWYQNRYWLPNPSFPSSRTCMGPRHQLMRESFLILLPILPVDMRPLQWWDSILLAIFCLEMFLLPQPSQGSQCSLTHSYDRTLLSSNVPSSTQDRSTVCLVIVFHPPGSFFSSYSRFTFGALCILLLCSIIGPQPSC